MVARAVLCTELDDFNTWKVVTKEKPTASAGKVVVKMTLVPVHLSVTLSPPLFMAHFGPNRIVIGSEGVGYVEEVGANVTKVKKGQRVVPSFLKLFYKSGNGSWQDYVVAAEEDLFVLPDSIPDEVAAQFIGSPWTVYGMLVEQNLSKGDYLLQGAAGSVLGRWLNAKQPYHRRSFILSWKKIIGGSYEAVLLFLHFDRNTLPLRPTIRLLASLPNAVIQLAKHWGIKTINVVRRDDVKDELKKLGADEVINSSTEDVAARVKEITEGKLADGALDPVGGKATQVMASSVKSGGKLFVYGLLGTKDHTSTIYIFDLGRVNIQFWSQFRFVEEKTPAIVGAEVIKLLERKVFEPLSGKKFKLEEFKEAIIQTEKPGRGGKVFLSL